MPVRPNRWMILTLICTLGFASAAAADDHEAASGEGANAVEDEASPYDYTGPYVRAAYSFASFDEDDSDIQFDDAHGFTAAVGWRQSGWAAVELSFSAFYGSETDDFLEFDRVPLDETDGTKKLTSSEMAISGKFYPFGFEALRDFEESPLLFNIARLVPERVQPYGAIGLGWSLQDVDVLDQTRVAFRFAGGLDVIVWEPVAITIEGGYTLHEYLVRRKKGTHIQGTRHVSLGATLRF